MPAYRPHFFTPNPPSENPVRPIYRYKHYGYDAESGSNQRAYTKTYARRKRTNQSSVELSASKAIFRARTYNCIIVQLFSSVMMITWWMKLGGNRPPGDAWDLYMPSRIDEAGHTKAFITQSRSTGRKVKERNGPWWDSNPHVLTPMSPKSNSTTYATLTPQSEARKLLQTSVARLQWMHVAPNRRA